MFNVIGESRDNNDREMYRNVLGYVSLNDVEAKMTKKKTSEMFARPSGALFSFLRLTL